MHQERKIKTALISVYNKDDLKPLIKELNSLDITIFSTGGTMSFIEKCGIHAESIEELTSYPSILGGRVKTLHPKVFGGILARRDLKADISQMGEYGIPEVDLVIVDLYPFSETVASTTDESEIIEKIDIGGISLIRAAAKNFNDVLVVSSRKDYQKLLYLLKKKNGFSNLSDRKEFAEKAFHISSTYDQEIFNYFKGEKHSKSVTAPETKVTELRYGENPHQKGYYYGDIDKLIEKMHGKELSYNNLVDVDAAIGLVNEFDEPTFVIIKHTNCCGAASKSNLLEAWKDALAGDPVSAFGGIIACNRSISAELSIEINKIFIEVVIAPDFEKEGLAILTQKKNIRILKHRKFSQQSRISKSILNGIIEQDNDLKTENEKDLQYKTEKIPTQSEIEDLLFANKIVKHLKSNAIALVKNKQLIGSGIGQTSRVDALNQAILKTATFNFNTTGAVMASDAFFPFPDCVEIAHKAGIVSVIQPGGSIKDQDSIDVCNKNGMSMVFSGIRHFKH